MTLEEKEAEIASWPHPFPERAEIARRTRDDKLKDMDDRQVERELIEREYAAAIDRMIAER
jgi:hypothetical protein